MKSNLTLKVDSGLWKRYKAYCKDKGVIPSRKFEIMMQKELKKEVLK